eukprot:snap_masked-scaffold_9-processed-gene-6.16-mRNA-1 protein AED:1.00 eAED:1.00 QI:0/0/0/0/1/1/2/0/196
MSFLHRVAPKEELRQKAVEKVQQYFEDNNLLISSLSLKSVILPEPNAIFYYPKSTPCHELSEEFCCDFEDLWHPRNFLDLCDNLDEFFDRVHIIRSVFLVYSEGIVLYKAQINELKCGRVCFCWRKNSGDYDEYPEEIVFYPWREKLIRLPKGTIEEYKSSYFVRFWVDLHQFYLPIKTYCHLKSFQEAYEKLSQV